MTEQTREGLLAASFVSLADTLVVGYDVVDLLQTLVETCATVLDAAAVGLLLADEGNVLEVVASTNERSRLLEILQLRAGLGPCVECYITGKVVSVPDVRELRDDWHVFREGALEQGFLSVHAVPLRLRGFTMGALNLFRETTGALNSNDAAAAQALADVATIGIVHERAMRQSELTREQLQRALDSRVIIEQAKGVIAQSKNIDMNGAFSVLREYARSNSLSLTDLAGRVVERTIIL
ncbi:MULTISPECIES: GAF and ANTAR domain-containing protein [Subtercola]|uniref:ANTAR domain-containing protein n=1 Tax=Subtercola vilae TaxID=2056433 RepID=A0A4T2C866_9MICO|nr:MULTISPECIES: GAF and ANTAR domain-containing protein [Subtercola]MEA9986817.1 GAF and ANTAR domain-containing protein [Subtercola sp. RTI3]TIH40370.1 ANTAR domain-containing protein [Subtercola vilae]